MLGRVYFWLCPLRTPPYTQPSCLLFMLLRCPDWLQAKNTASQLGFLFLVKCTTVGLYPPRTLKGVIRQIISAFMCNLTDWNDKCQCTAEFLEWGNKLVVSVCRVLSSLNRKRRSTVVLGDSPSIAEPNRYPCRMDILTLFTTNTSIL